MPVPTREENYREEVKSTLNYLELKKIKKLINVNQKELEVTTSSERYTFLMQTHLRLKELETKITQQKGAVIIK